MKLKTVVKVLGALVGLVVIGLVVFALTFDASRYKPRLEAAAKDATGRDLRVADDLSLRILPSPALRVKGVTLSNASWGTQPEMLKVGSFAAEVALWPLLRGAVVVKRVVLEDADVLLETNAKGEGNWAFAPAGAPAKGAAPPPNSAAPPPAETPAQATSVSGAGFVPLVHEVALRNTRVAYRDGATGRTRQLVLERGEIEADGAADPLHIALKGAVDALRFAVEGEVGSLSGLAPGSPPWPVKIATTLADDLRLEVEGTIAEPRAARGLDLALRANAKDVGDVARAAKVASPISGPLSFSAKVSDPAPNTLRIADLALTMEAGDVKGTATLVRGGVRPALEADFASTLLDTTKLGGVAAASAAGAPPPPVAAAPANDGRVIPATPLPFASLGAADAQVRFRADTLVTANGTLKDAGGTLSLRDEQLDLENVKAGLAGGRIAMSTTVAAKGQRVATKLSLAGVDLGALLRETKRSDLVRRAPTDLELDVQGSGATARDVASTLAGRVVSITRDGEIDSRVLDYLGDAAALWKPLAGQGVTKLSCAVVRFDLAGGVARAVTLLVDVGPAVITGDGTADLRSEAVKMLLTPRASTGKLASVPVPLLVGGSLAKLSFTPDVVSTALDAVKTFGGKKLRGEAGAIASLLGVESAAAPLSCAQAEAQAQGRAPAPAPRTESPSQQQTQDAVRDVEKGLKSLFGR